MFLRRYRLARRAKFAGLMCLLCLAIASSAVAEDLIFGMSTALTGPAAELGINMRAGVESAFAEANESGGIQDRPLKLIALDDGYEPSRAAPNMHQLIDKHQVLAVVGNVGTPTAVVAAPIAVREKTLFFGAFTGAGVLRPDPPERFIINYRASYAEETSAMVDALVNQFGFAPQEIAFFTQRDAYGDSGYIGGLTALQRHGLVDEHSIVHGRYERNTIAVENAVADILLADQPPRAIILVGAYKPCAAFIKLAKDSGIDALFLNVSFVGAEPLRRTLGHYGEGVIVTQVVPYYRSNLRIVAEYRNALERSHKDIDASFGSLEGYLAGRVLLKALRTIETSIDRDSIVDALIALGTFEIGLGEPLCLSSDDHQASHAVWPTVVRGGEIVPTRWDELIQEQSVR